MRKLFSLKIPGLEQWFSQEQMVGLVLDSSDLEDRVIDFQSLLLVIEMP